MGSLTKTGSYLNQKSVPHCKLRVGVCGSSQSCGHKGVGCVLNVRVTLVSDIWANIARASIRLELWKVSQKLYS